MARSQATSPDDYLAELPPDRALALRRVRDVVRRHLPEGYEEGMQYGMISWYVPFSRLPKTSNGQPLAYVGLANQKSYMSLYLMNVYGDAETEAWFRGRFAASGHRLDMGKSCVRFRSADDLPLDVIGETIARTPVDRYVAKYRASRGE